MLVHAGRNLLKVEKIREKVFGQERPRVPLHVSLEAAAPAQNKSYPPASPPGKGTLAVLPSECKLSNTKEWIARLNSHFTHRPPSSQPNQK